MKTIKKLLSFLSIALTLFVVLAYFVRFISADSSLGFVTPISIGYNFALQFSLFIIVVIIFIVRNKWTVFSTVICLLVFCIDFP